METSSVGISREIFNVMLDLMRSWDWDVAQVIWQILVISWISSLPLFLRTGVSAFVLAWITYHLFYLRAAASWFLGQLLHEQYHRCRTGNHWSPQGTADVLFVLVCFNLFCHVETYLQSIPFKARFSRSCIESRKPRKCWFQVIWWLIWFEQLKMKSYTLAFIIVIYLCCLLTKHLPTWEKIWVTINHWCRLKKCWEWLAINVHSARERNHTSLSLLCYKKNTVSGINNV